ncbi:GPR endopeptidase [Bacillus thermotolerans]|uniref:Germination protease n=1 Tax=Bacillus thermotolerans TaxID=1221996 RepID=A0A0F5HT20_BACTR|nr:GPR endopeptidase [Bacillus thermotolerans]KKB36408.1 Endopeptidase spore protease Gpr [Bacillus thermotolerans]KKB43183.1 Endopeptidase spore protease Gpr [Bacillus thermotolerans]
MKDPSIDLSHYAVRTDLAVEAKALAEERPEQKQKMTGILTEEREINGIKITTVSIDEAGAEATGKKAGDYLTIESQGIRSHDTEHQHEVEKVLAKELSAFLKNKGIKEDASCLIVGLGNRDVTPDALGPLVCGEIMVTRHLFELQPDQVEEGFRPVASLVPGVMGLTGVETSDIVFGVVEKTKPDFLIVIDALASRSIERVNATVQVADSGIHPGAGVGNKRKEISEKTLGIPVIAIGVPTVVDAVSITSDTIDFILKHLGKEIEEGNRPSGALAPAGYSFGRSKLTEEDLPDEENRRSFLGVVGTLPDEEKRQLIREVLAPIGHNLMVTPKEVDLFIKDTANLLANSLNAALHSAIDQENTGFYTK